MINVIFDKSDKGREEIATRKYHLPARLRSLLLLIDGKHGSEDLLKKFAGLGLNDQTIKELLDSGFIQSTAAASKPEVLPAAAESSQAATDASGNTQDNSMTGTILEKDETQLQAIYNFYSQTIKSTVGLRGYALQLKVERAGSIEDFRALRAPYLEAVFKAKGTETARDLRDRLDRLLYLGEQAPQTTDLPGSGY